MAEKLLDYRRIAVKGITALERAGRHTIRVFAQVEGFCKQSMATQGEAVCCYISVEDACETGCASACDRASQNANCSSAYQTVETLASKRARDQTLLESSVPSSSVNSIGGQTGEEIACVVGTIAQDPERGG